MRRDQGGRPSLDSIVQAVDRRPARPPLDAIVASVDGAAEPSLTDKAMAMLRGTGAAVAAFAPAAIEGLDRGVGAMLEAVPGQNAVSRAVRGGGRSLRGLADRIGADRETTTDVILGSSADRAPTYATAGYAGTAIPLELAKYIAMGPVAGASVSALENAGSAPDQSTAGLMAKGASLVGADRAADFLRQASESARGRTAADLGFNLVGDVAVRAGGRALEAIRSARAPKVRGIPEPLALPPGRYEMPGATFTSRDVPEMDPTRLLPAPAAPIPAVSGVRPGPGLPMPGATPGSLAVQEVTDRVNAQLGRLLARPTEAVPTAGDRVLGPAIPARGELTPAQALKRAKEWAEQRRAGLLGDEIEKAERTGLADDAVNIGELGGARSVRSESGAVASDLSKVSDASLEDEARRLAEQLSEARGRVSFMDTPEWASMRDLPDAERTGTRRITDLDRAEAAARGESLRGQKRKVEDLPDGDGAFDPDKLAEMRKMASEFQRSKLVIEKQEGLLARLNDEIARRQAIRDKAVADATSFDFGANVEAAAAAPPLAGASDFDVRRMQQLADEQGIDVRAAGVRSSRTLPSDPAVNVGMIPDSDLRAMAKSLAGLAESHPAYRADADVLAAEMRDRFGPAGDAAVAGSGVVPGASSPGGSYVRPAGNGLWLAFDANGNTLGAVKADSEADALQRAATLRKPSGSTAPVSDSGKKEFLDIVGEFFKEARPPKGDPLGPSFGGGTTFDIGGAVAAGLKTRAGQSGALAGTGLAMQGADDERVRTAGKGLMVAGAVRAGAPALRRAASVAMRGRPEVDAAIADLRAKMGKFVPGARTPGASAVEGGARAATEVELTPVAEATAPKNRVPLMRRMNLSPDMQDRVAAKVAQIEAGIRRPVTWDEVRAEAAKELNLKGDKLLELSPRKVTGAQALALAQMTREMTERINTLGKAFLAETDDAARATIREEMDALDGRANQTLSLLMKADTEAGRSLAARRLLANLTTDPTYWMLKAQRVKGGESLAPAEKETVNAFLNTGDRAGLVSYLAGLRRDPWYQQVVVLRKAGLLTAIKGRLADFLSTGGNILSESVLQAPEAAVDALASLVAARKVQNAGKLGVPKSQFRTAVMPSPQQTKATLRGAWDGIGEAAKLMGWSAAKEGGARGLVDFIRSAQVDPSVLQRLDVPRQTNITLLGDTKANAALDFYQKFVLRASGATDKLFKTAAYNGALVEQAKLTAMREGLSGPAAAKRADALLKAPTDEMVTDAMAAAEMLTFNNDGTLSRALSAGITAAESAAGPFGKLLRAATDWVLPFRRTPANVATRVAEYVPGISQAIALKRGVDWWGKVAELSLASPGAVGEAMRETRHAQRALVETLTRGTAGGAGLVGLGIYLALQDRMTGAAPVETSKREQWRLEGRQPNSILIGGKWIPVGRIAPMGSLLAVGANLVARHRAGGTAVEKAGAVPFDIARTVLDQPMVTGVSRTLEAVTDPSGGAAEEWVSDQVGSLVPTIVAQSARSDGLQRRPGSLGESVKARIPGLASAVPVRRNVFGEPVRVAGGVGAALNPLAGVQDRRQLDPLVQTLSDAGVSIAPLVRRQGESQALYEWRQEQGGAWLREDLAALVGSEEFAAADQVERKRLIRSQVLRTRSEFSRQLREQYGLSTNPE